MSHCQRGSSSPAREARADFRAFLHYNGPRHHKSRDLVQSWIWELECELSQITFLTPLSDAIEDIHLNSGTQDSIADFVQVLAVGVIALGVPPNRVGDCIGMPEHPVSVGTNGDCKDMVLVFADPEATCKPWAPYSTRRCQGESVLQTVVHNLSCNGVRVNSAKTTISLLIDLHTAVSLLYADKAATALSQRPWWKFW